MQQGAHKGALVQEEAWPQRSAAPAPSSSSAASAAASASSSATVVGLAAAATPQQAGVGQSSSGGLLNVALGLLGGFGAAFLWQRAKGARVAAAGGAPQRLALSEADADAEEELSDGDEGAEARVSTTSSRVKMVMKVGGRLD